MKDRSSFKIRG